MTRMYSGLLILCTAGAMSLAACSGNSGSSTPAVTATAHPLAIAYTAIGASDAVGYGSTVPCTKASPALVADPTCPEAGASGYVPDIRTDLAGVGFSAALQDLGISGSVIGPDILALRNKYNPATCAPRPAADNPGDFLTNELPSVNPSALLVTIFAGGNDVNAIVTALACGAGGGTAASQTAFVTAQVTAFGHDFAQLVGSVHATAPKATIVIANIPNFANVPYAFALSSNPAVDGALRTALQQVSVAIDTNVINTVVANGIPVVDLQCDPRSYNTANFYTDGFHPNDTGYATLAADFVGQALANAPVAPQMSCAFQGLSASPGATPMSVVRHSDNVVPLTSRFVMPG